MTLYRKFPVNKDMTKHVRIPIDGEGRPIESSKAWQTLVANAMAKSPEDRNPAETALVRRLCQIATARIQP